MLDIDSIDKLYVTDAAEALRQIGKLRAQCEATGWKACSEAHLEAVESQIHHRLGDHRNSQKHAYAALAAPKEEDNTWRLVAYQTLCESFHSTGNYALLGKYAMKMSQEANLPAFSALARIYEAQAIGRTGAPETAISQVDTALYIMESSKPRTRNEKFNALLLYYLALETKIQICHEAGRYKEAYDYSMQHLERLEQEERKGYDDMDLNGFKTERLAVYLKLANICQDSGKDGSQWFEKGMQLYQELEHSERTTCEVADYLFSTGQYERYERIIVPALEDFLKKAPTQPAMHMVWQWTNILSASGRQDELARWTMKGMEMGKKLVGHTDKYAGTDFLMAYESELKDKEIETQQAEITANRLKTIAITVITVLIAAGFAVTLISWRRQKHNVKFLYRQIEENRQKARLAEEQMLQASHVPPASHEAEDKADEDNKTDMDLLTTLHDFLKEEGRFLDSGLTMEQIARQLSVRQKKLNATLQALKGTTLVGYVRDMRMEYACDLLRNHPEMKVEAVAMQSGYNTPRQFMRAFKEKYNITLSEYRHASLRDKKLHNATPAPEEE